MFLKYFIIQTIFLKNKKMQKNHYLKIFPMKIIEIILVFFLLQKKVTGTLIEDYQNKPYIYSPSEVNLILYI